MADDDKPKNWVFDLDFTVTRAPRKLGRLARLIRAGNDVVIVLTANDAPRDELKQKLDELDFPYDRLETYKPDDDDGQTRADVLRKLDAWFAWDDKIARAPALVQACAHAFVITEPKKRDKGGRRSVMLIGGEHNGEVYETLGLASTIELADGSIYRMADNGEPTARYLPEATGAPKPPGLRTATKWESKR
jgi:hypothetical protein